MKNKELFFKACELIPGGVNSPVRAFKSVGGTPIFAQKGEGAYFVDAEGKRYLDFCGSWGPLLFGHAHPKVVSAIIEATPLGTSFGMCTKKEIDFAQKIIDQIPYAEQIRLVSSGTEAVMTALRLARGYTKRNKILKFDGGYHGHSDSLLVAAGSALLESASSSSAGVSQKTASDTFVVPYNDIAAVKEVVTKNGDDLAAIIVEPVAGNMGLVIPCENFLSSLRELADQCGALLIFDEVITGFRLAPTTYGTICGVEPDITTMGKIIGGGLPLGALFGKKTIMEYLAPCGPVYQAGTLSGNPICLAAGEAMLDLILTELPYARLEKFAIKIKKALLSHAEKLQIPLTINQIGGLFTIFFCNNEVVDLTTAKQSDLALHSKFFHAMLERGIYLPPAQFEAAFVSAVHTEGEIDCFIENACDALSEIYK